MATVPISALCAAFPQITHVKSTDNFSDYNTFFRDFKTSPQRANVEVILASSVILVRLPPLTRQGSHEREITDIDAGNNFGFKLTTA